MAPRFTPQSPSEQEIASYLTKAAQGQAGVNPKALRQSKSRNPRIAAAGQEAVDDQLKANEQARQIADRQAAEAERMAAKQSKQAESMAKEQARAAEAARMRNVRQQAAQGVKTTTNIETGRRDIATHPDGAPVYKAGPQGAPKHLGSAVEVLQESLATPTAPPPPPRSVPNLGIMTGGGDMAGAVTAQGTERQAIFGQTVRDDRGNLSVVEPESITDPKTGNKIHSATDPTTGKPVKTIVGVDPVAAAKAQKLQQIDVAAQDIAMRENNVKQAAMSVMPRFDEAKKEYDRKRAEFELVTKDRLERRDGGVWVKVDADTGKESYPDAREVSFYQAKLKASQDALVAAKSAHDKFAPGAQNIERVQAEIAAEKLKLAERRMKIEAGLPDDDAGIAADLAKQAGMIAPDNSPTDRAAAHVEQQAEAQQEQVAPPIEAQDTPDTKDVFKAIGGLEGTTLEKSEKHGEAMVFINRNGRHIATQDTDRDGEKSLILTPDATKDAEVNRIIANAGTGGMPTFTQDNPKRRRVGEEAQWAAGVFQVLEDPQMFDEATGKPFPVMQDVLRQKGAMPEQIAESVRNGSLSIQRGEAIMRNVWGQTLAAPDPTAPETFQKWIADKTAAAHKELQDRYGKPNLRAENTAAERWADTTNLGDRERLKTEFWSDWYRENRGKPGVSRQWVQNQMGADLGESAGTKAKSAARSAVRLVVQDVIGSMLGLAAGVAHDIGAGEAALFGNSEAAKDLKESLRLKNRDTANFWNAAKRNIAKWTTSEGRQIEGDLNAALSKFRSVFDEEHEKSAPDAKRIQAAESEVRAAAMAFHNLNNDPTWPVTEDSLDATKDQALGSALANYALTADPSFFALYRDRLLMDNGRRQQSAELEKKTFGATGFQGAVAGAMFAGWQEVGSEMIADAAIIFTGGASKAAQMSLRAAGAAGKAKRIGTLSARMAAALERAGQFGVKAETLAKPLTGFQRATNTAKRVVGTGIKAPVGEGLEGVAVEVGADDPNFVQAFAMEALGGVALTPVFHGGSAIMSGVREEAATQREANISRIFADRYNAAMDGTPGFETITPEQAGVARMFVNPDAFKAAVGQMVSASKVIADPKASEESKLVAKNILDSIRPAVAAGTESAVAAAREISAIADPAERMAATALAKVASGNAYALTPAERAAVEGRMTATGSPYFQSTVNPNGTVTETLTDEARAEVATQYPAVGAIMATPGSAAALERITQIPQANEQNTQGQQQVMPGAQAAPAGEAQAATPIPANPAVGGPGQTGTGAGAVVNPSTGGGAVPAQAAPAPAPRPAYAPEIVTPQSAVQAAGEVARGVQASLKARGVDVAVDETGTGIGAVSFNPETGKISIHVRPAALEANGRTRDQMHEVLENEIVNHELLHAVDEQVLQEKYAEALRGGFTGTLAEFKEAYLTQMASEVPADVWEWAANLYNDAFEVFGTRQTLGSRFFGTKGKTVRRSALWKDLTPEQRARTNWGQIKKESSRMRELLRIIAEASRNRDTADQVTEIFRAKAYNQSPTLVSYLRSFVRALIEKIKAGGIPPAVMDHANQMVRMLNEMLAGMKAAPGAQPGNAAVAQTGGGSSQSPAQPAEVPTGSLPTDNAPTSGDVGATPAPSAPAEALPEVVAKQDNEGGWSFEYHAPVFALGNATLGKSTSRKTGFKTEQEALEAGRKHRDGESKRAREEAGRLLAKLEARGTARDAENAIGLRTQIEEWDSKFKRAREEAGRLLAKLEARGTARDAENAIGLRTQIEEWDSKFVRATQATPASGKPAYTNRIGERIEYLPNGMARVTEADGTATEGPEADIEADFYASERVMAGEFSEAESRYPELKNRGLASDLTDVVEGLVEVLDTIEPHLRPEFMRNAIDAYMEDRRAAEEQQPDGTEAPAKKPRRRTISVSKSFIEARRIIAEDGHRILSELGAQGIKIAPPPNAIALIRARKRDGKRLTEKEIRIIRDASAWDGMPRRSDYANTGRGKILREVIGQIMARQGEGERPDVVASNYFDPTWNASDLWVEIGKELKAIFENKTTENDPRNTNREDWTDEEIAAEEAKREQQQAENFDAANDPDNGGKPMPVADFTPEWVGVTIRVDGEPMTVTSVEMDEAGENAVSVTLDDHFRFGRQTLENGETVWAEMNAATDEEGDPLFSGRSNQQPMFDFGATGSMGTRDQIGFDFGSGQAPRIRPVSDRVEEIAEEFGQDADLPVKLSMIAPKLDTMPADQRADFMAAVDAEAARLRSGVLSATDWQRRSGDRLSERAAMFQRFIDSHTDKTIAGGFAKLMSPPVQQSISTVAPTAPPAAQAGFRYRPRNIIEGIMSPDFYYETANPTSVPDGHRVIASEIYERKIGNRHSLYRISVVDNGNGGKYSMVEGGQDIYGTTTNAETWFNELSEYDLESRPMAPVAERARKLWEDQRSQEGQQSLFAGRSESSVAPFYSQLARTLEAKMPKSAPVAQVMQIAASGAKAEEIKWSGLLPWMQSNAVDGKVSKDAVLKYLADEGAVRFEEKTIGKPTAQEREAIESATRRLRDAGFEVVQDEGFGYALERGGKPVYINQLSESDRNDLNILTSTKRDQVAATKYAQYTLPGGENYREVVLAMPEKRIPAENSVGAQEIERRRLAGEISNEEAHRQYKALKRGLGIPEPSYTSTHFPDVPNYVAHMRLNERTDADGKPGMFIEEIQSDRHQDGRDKGYGPVQFNVAKEGNEWISRYPDGRIHASGDTEQQVRDVIARENVQGVAPAPFEKTWPLAMFKRALRDAVAGGKKWIGWTVGDTQNDRYDLSKQVDDIAVWRNGELYGFDASKDGRRVPAQNGITAKELADNIGKELAERAIKELADNPKTRTYKGDDLRVGGSGMKGFYDNILPKEIGKYVRQWGGKVEKGEIDTTTSQEKPKSFNDWRESVMPDGTPDRVRELYAQYRGSFAAPAPIWRVNITPEMAKGVEAGQALFAGRSAPPMPPRPPSYAFERAAERMNAIRGGNGPLRGQPGWDEIIAEEEAVDAEYERRLGEWLEGIPENQPITFTRQRRDTDLPNYYTVTKNTTDKDRPWRTTYFSTLPRPDWTPDEEIEYEDMFKKTRWVDSSNPEWRKWNDRLFELGSRPTTTSETRIVPSGHDEQTTRLEALKHAMSMVTGDGLMEPKIGPLFAGRSYNPGQEAFDFNQTVSGDKQQRGLDFGEAEQSVTGPRATFKANAQAAHDKAPEQSKARENIAGAVAQREGLTGEKKAAFITAGNQGFFDFGTTSSFDTKTQPGFDFNKTPTRAPQPSLTSAGERQTKPASKESDTKPAVKQSLTTEAKELQPWEITFEQWQKLPILYGKSEAWMAFHRAIMAKATFDEAQRASKKYAPTSQKSPLGGEVQQPISQEAKSSEVEVFTGHRSEVMARNPGVVLAIARGATGSRYTLWQRVGNRQWDYIRTLPTDKTEAIETAAMVARMIAGGNGAKLAFTGSKTYTPKAEDIAKGVAVSTDELSKADLEEAAPATEIGTQNVGFGKYADLPVAELAKTDPDYAMWLYTTANRGRGLQVRNYLDRDPVFLAFRDAEQAAKQDEADRIAAAEAKIAAKKTAKPTETPNQDGQTAAPIQPSEKPAETKKLERREAAQQFVTLVSPREDAPDMIPANLKASMFPMQISGANAAIASLAANGAFLNGDGAGVGKTRQILAVASHYAKQGKPVVIITENAAIGKPWEGKGTPAVGGSMAKDSEAMGVQIDLMEDGKKAPAGEIRITTYHRVTPDQIPSGTVVIFDESQNLANIYGDLAKETGNWKQKFGTIFESAERVAYYSATPADKPHQLAYLYRVLGFDSPDHYLSEARGNGMITRIRKFGRQEQKSYDIPGSNRGRMKLYGWVNASMKRAGDDGRFVKREISYEGTDIQFQDVKGTDTEGNPWAVHHAEVMADINDQLRRGAQVLAPRSYELYAAELTKIGNAVELAKRELAAGRKVVLYFSRIREMEMKARYWVKNAITGESEPMPEFTFGTIPSPVDLLKGELAKEGIKFAELHGKSGDTSKTAQAKFAGEVDVLLASVESGGTGINLDDMTGKNPRTVIFMFAPYRGISTVQAMGRSWRASTVQSDFNPNRFAFIVASDISIDAARSTVLAKKLQIMRATIGGTAVTKLPMSKVTFDRTQLEGLEIPDNDEASNVADRPLSTEPLKPVNIKWTLAKSGATWWARATADLLEWIADDGPERTGIGVKVVKKPDGYLAFADADYKPEEFAQDGGGMSLFAGASSVTPEQDAAYLAAVERGDMETAQRMVDEKANLTPFKRELWHGTTNTKYVEGKSNDGDTQAREKLKEIAAEYGIKDWTSVANVFERWVEYGMATENGITVADATEARRLYEASKGTNEPGQETIGFDVFSMPSQGLELGVHLGTQQQAESFGSVFRFRVAIANPLRLPDLGTWNYQSVMREARKRGVKISEEEYDAVFNARDENQALRDLLIRKGYDGIIYRNEAEGTGDSFIAFKPSQIKSADPVTRDADGNVISLSQRFNPQSDSILYAGASSKSGQGFFDFGAEGTYSTKDQLGFVFGAPEVKAAEKEQEAPTPVEAGQPEPEEASPQPGTEEFKLLPQEVKREIAMDTAKRKQAEREGITDFGEKIGGARKDKAVKTGPKEKRETTEEKKQPGWRRRYEIGEIVVPKSMIEEYKRGNRWQRQEAADNGRFQITDKRKTDAWGQPLRPTDKTFATSEEAEAAIPLIEVSRNHRVRSERVEGTGATMAERKAYEEAVSENRNHPGATAYRIIETAKQRFNEGRLTSEQRDKMIAEHEPFLKGYKPLDMPEPKRPDYRYTIWREVSDRKRVQAVAMTFPTEEEALRYMAENAVDLIEGKTSFGEEIIVTAKDPKREGPVRRQGKATEQMFMDTFGFRGVEFGNWVEQDGSALARQAVMDFAYDGLHDLADILGVPPRAISLNGELSLAFGARGTGGKGAARAHYEPTYGVINLTKRGGAGTLAHEWMHAVDHYFGRQDGLAPSERFKTGDGGMAFRMPPKGSSPYVSDGFSYDSKTRKEIRDAWKAVLETATKKMEGYTEDIGQNEKRLKYRRDEMAGAIKQVRDRLTSTPDPRWEKRKKPATDEQLATFDAITGKMLDGTFAPVVLKGFENKSRMSVGTFRYTNDDLETLGEIYKAVHGRSGFGKDGTGDIDRLRQYATSMRTTMADLQAAKDAQVKMRSISTDFLKGAKQLDTTRGKDYWSTPIELMARAFSSYIEDRIADSGRRSDYLSFGSQNAFYSPWKPFPEGEEREAINKAFDNLFEVMDTRETDNGVALFAGSSKYSTLPLNNSGATIYPHSTTGVLYPDGHEIRISQSPPDQIPDGGEKIWDRISKDGGRNAVSLRVQEGENATEDPAFTEWLTTAILDAADGENGRQNRFAELLANAVGSPSREAPKATVRGFWKWLASTLNSEAMAGFDPVETLDALAGILQLPQPVSERAAPAEQLHYVRISPDGSVLYADNFGRFSFGRLPTEKEIADAKSPLWDDPATALYAGKSKVTVPDLFTAANAPENAASLAQVKVGTMNALGAYKALTAKRAKTGRLTADEEEKLLAAEQALGQKLAFDMDAVKSVGTSIENDKMAFGMLARKLDDENYLFTNDEREAFRKLREKLLAAGVPSDEVWAIENGEIPDSMPETESLKNRIYSRPSKGAGRIEYGHMGADGRIYPASGWPMHNDGSWKAVTRDEVDRRLAAAGSMNDRDLLIQGTVSNAAQVERFFVENTAPKPAAEFGTAPLAPKRKQAEIDTSAGLFGDDRSFKQTADGQGMLFAGKSNESGKLMFAAMDKLPPLFRKVFEETAAGATPQEIMRKYPVVSSEQAVLNILARVEAHLSVAAQAVQPGGMKPEMRGSDILAGRPDLALSTNPMVAAVDQARQMAYAPGKRADAEVFAEGEARLAADYDGEFAKLRDMAANLDRMNDVETYMAQRIIATETMKGIPADPVKRMETALFIHGYRDTGTEDARAFRMRYDKEFTPAERHAKIIAEALFTPDEKTRRMMRTAKKGEIQDILKPWLDKVDRIKGELLQHGIDLDAMLGDYAAFRAARDQAAKDFPEGMKAFEMAFRKLSAVEKIVIRAMRDGASQSQILKSAMISNAEAAKIVNSFFTDSMTFLDQAYKKLMETVLAAGATNNALEAILNANGVYRWEQLDDSKPDWIHPSKPQPKKRKTDKPEVSFNPTPEQQAELDAAWERFKNADPANWTTFWETEMKNLAPMVGMVGFQEFKGKAQQAWKARQQGLGIEPINETTGPFKPQGREGSLFPQPINETTGGYDVNDPAKMKTVVTAFSTARGTTMDKIMEFWRASILSGPQTHIVNTSSNIAHAAFNLLPRRGAEALVNTILGPVGLGSEKAATFGEFVPMARELRKGLNAAVANALGAWKLEERFFNDYAESKAVEVEFTGLGAETYERRLGGKLGTVMRSISFRAMTAADEFIKTLYGHFDAAAQAHRIAVEEKLKGKAYDARMAELMIRGSKAWLRARDNANMIAFQEPVDPKNPRFIANLDRIADLAKKGRRMPYLGRGMTFFLPFIDTPLNIFKQAVELSPIGGFLAVVDGARALNRRFNRGGMSIEQARAEAEQLYDRARLVRDITNQTVALAAFYAIQQLVAGDDDEEGLPFLTGTMPYKTTDRGVRDNAYRVMPPMTLRVGKLQFSYARFEPFATALASAADFIAAMNARGGVKPEVFSEWAGRFKEQVKEKTFLQGLASMFSALEDPDRFAERIASNITTGFIPNIIRQPIREAQTNQRDTAPQAGDGFFTSLAKSVGFSLAPGAAPLKIDVWGNPIKANRGDMVGGSEPADMFFRVLDPTNAALAPKADPVDLYIFHWNMRTPDSKDKIGIEPIRDRMQIQFPGEKKPTQVSLTPAEHEEINRKAGKAARAALGDKWDWKNPTEQGAKAIIETVTAYQTAARAELRSRKIAEWMKNGKPSNPDN